MHQIDYYHPVDGRMVSVQGSPVALLDHLRELETDLRVNHGGEYSLPHFRHHDCGQWQPVLNVAAGETALPMPQWDFGSPEGQEPPPAEYVQNAPSNALPLPVWNFADTKPQVPVRDSQRLVHRTGGATGNVLPLPTWVW